MTRWKRLKAWIQRKRGKEPPSKPLREFAYLDEVSVTSLLASQSGTIIQELTETQSSSLTSGVNTTAGVSVPGVKSELRSRMEATESSGSQVLRKALIETHFALLLDAAQQAMVLEAPSRSNQLTPNTGLADLLRAEAPSAGVVAASDLRRGHLLQADVYIDPDATFRLITTLSAMTEVARDIPGVVGTQLMQELKEMEAFNKVLDKLLAGLVPIQGEMVNWRRVFSDGHWWLVHKTVLSQVTDEEVGEPAFVVGVAEKTLFRRDLRRVLFSSSKYRVLARLRRDSLSSEWTPVQLAEILGTAIPDLNSLTEFSTDALAQLNEEGATNAEEERFRRALLSHAAAMSERTVEELEPQLDAAGLLDPMVLARHQTVQERRPAFAAVERLMGSDDPVKASQNRWAAWEAAGIPDSSDDAPALAPSETGHGPRFLECDLIALYW